jgi:hypothetical protein
MIAGLIFLLYFAVVVVLGHAIVELYKLFKND